MAEIALPGVVPGAPVSRVLGGTVDLFEAVFPGRIRGYYLLGSYADGTGISGSDLDLDVVFRDHFAGEAENALAGQVARGCARLSPVELDVEAVDEATLAAGSGPAFKLGSLLVYGEDIRDQVPLLSLAAWTRARMHSSYGRLAWLFARPPMIRYPLDYPDPAAEFYGYDRRLLRLADGREVPGTRDLIRAVGWAATALLAWRAGYFVARKSACHRAYAALIGDEWAPFLAEVYDCCRMRWQYRIPEGAADRARLRAICARTLAFENSFLLRYRDFVLAELAAADPAAQQQAIAMLGRVPWPDPAIRAALSSVG